MEKLKEIITKFEETLGKEINIESLSDCEESLKNLETLIKQIKEKFGELRNLDKIQDSFTDFEKNFDSLNNSISNKFVKLIDTMQTLESESSPKSIILPKLDKIFEEITKDNLFDISVYNEIVNDLKVRMEIDLVGKIERELFGIRDSFRGNKRIPEILNEYQNEIQKLISEFKQKYRDNFKSKKIVLNIDESFVSNINNSFTQLSQNVSKLNSEVTTKLTAYHTLLIHSLNELNEKINRVQLSTKSEKTLLENKISELTKEIDRKTEAISGLEKENEELKISKADITKELEAKTKKIEELEDNISKIKADQETLRKDLELKIKNIEELELNKIEMIKSGEELASELELKAKKLEQLEANSSTLMGDKEGLTKELETKIQIIEELDANRTTLLAEKADLTQQLEAKIKLLETLETKEKELEDNKQVLTQDLELKSKLVEELETKSSNLIQDKEKLTEELEAKTKILEDLEKSKTELETNTSKLTEELEGKAKTIEEQTAKIEELSKDLEEKNRVIQELELNNKTLESAKDELANKLENSKKLEDKIAKLELELKDVTQFVEKSPKYQLLYLINNLGKTPVKKIKELTKFDEGIITSALQDLNQRGLITIVEENENIFVSIKQKLNPLSCLELPLVFDNELINILKEHPDSATFEKTFDDIIAQIGKYKADYREVAGYLLSVLYLYIYESRNFQLFDKIQDLYYDLRKDSFYLKLIENALTRKPWESQKSATLDGLIGIPNLKIFNKDLEILSESSEAYHTDGPLKVEKYRALSLLNWENEITVEKSNLNQFSTVAELVNWVWLNGQGTHFFIQFNDLTGKKYEIIVSDAEKIDAQLFVKKMEVVVD